MIHIQIATIDLTESILSVIVAAFEQYRDVLDPPSGVFSETPAQIQHKLETGGGFVAYEEIDDQLSMVGAVLYQPNLAYMYLGRLAVLPTYRGFGIARKLTNVVEQKAIEYKLPCVQLAVRLKLTDNQKFFQQLGYKIVSYEAHEGYSDPTFVTMEKQLSS